MSVNRSKEIFKVSYVGIGTNFALVALKALAGFMANSTTVILDAVNNLSDALSSAITIIGTKLASRDADREHPYGHGRIEYLTATVIALIVMAAGLTSMREAILKIITPAEVKYSIFSLIVITVGIITKFFLGKYFVTKGETLASQSLTASGTDAWGDAVISTATLISAMINMTLGVNLEGWLGAVISIFIFKAGLEVLTEAIDNIIGVRVDTELSTGIKAKLCSYDEVIGAYDFVVNNYGPDLNLGSVHIELSDTMTIREFDALTRRIVPDIYKEFGVYLTIGVYAANTSDEISMKIKEAVRRETDSDPRILQMHGFYADPVTKLVSFDVIIDFREKNAAEVIKALKEHLTAEFPDHSFNINLDLDFSD